MKRNYRKLFSKKSLRFRRWGHKSYSAFCSIGRHVTIGHVSKGIADASMEKAGAVDETLVERIIRRGGLDREEAESMAESVPLRQLVSMAAEVTAACASRRFDTCSIINAKSGRCPEDCKWCAQSAHYHTDASEYPLLDRDSILRAAKQCEEKGIGRFSIVTSGRRLTEKEIDSICSTAAYLRKECRISLCLSAGLLDKPSLMKLHRAGISRYHCNLETAPSYFGQLCSTHTQAEKIKTLSSAREAGMDICSGGIIGMGETMAQRLELAFTLRELGVKSVPVNILSPIKGTPLADQPLIPEDEIVRTVAMFRLIMPDAYLRFAGGRARLSEQALMTSFQAGINSAIIGDMLTTTGADVATDKARILAAGYILLSRIRNFMAAGAGKSVRATFL